MYINRKQATVEPQFNYHNHFDLSPFSFFLFPFSFFLFPFSFFLFPIFSPLVHVVTESDFPPCLSYTESSPSPITQNPAPASTSNPRTQPPIPRYNQRTQSQDLCKHITYPSAQWTQQQCVPYLHKASGQFTKTNPNTAKLLHPAVFTPEGSPDRTPDSDSCSGSSLPSTPSSLSLSNPASGMHTPYMSPVPQPLQLPPPTPPIINQMSHWDASLAWEGDKDPKCEPGQFLREIKAQIDKDGLLTNKQMFSRFKVNLWYGFQANLWFVDLDKVEKDTYEHLVEAFEKQWPLTKQPKASKAEWVCILKEWVLKPEELGEKVEGPDGSQVYAYIWWANGLAALARDTEDTSGFALGEVFNALPCLVKDLVCCEMLLTTHIWNPPAHLSTSCCCTNTSLNPSTSIDKPIHKHW